MSTKSPLALSRRSFVKRAGLGLGVAWIGLEAVETAVAGTRRAPAIDARYSDDQFLCGAQVYYPQQIAPDEFRRMLDGMANRYKLNIARIFPPWDYYNPAPGKFQFDDLEHILSICDE